VQLQFIGEVRCQFLQDVVYQKIIKVGRFFTKLFKW